MQIMGFIGCAYGTIVIRFEIKHIFGLILHIGFIYYGWHWMMSIVILDEEEFLKKQDQEYKEGVLKARAKMNDFIRLLNKNETVCMVFIPIATKKRKQIETWAEVDSYNAERDRFTAKIWVNEKGKGCEEAREIMVGKNQILDWQVYDGENFYGGFLIDSLESKIDKKGYRLDHKSQEEVEFLKSIRKKL